MANALDLQEKPQAKTMYMLAGWHQWADAGSISSGLPQYLVERTKARHIGTIKPDGFYLFQFPGTHDLMRPVVQFVDGYPEALDSPSNNLYYTEIDGHGIIILLGDEPHLDIERYVRTILDAADELKVAKIIGFGGVYAEVPYDKERTISCAYSKRSLKEELDKLSVNFSDYHGGAAIGSILCRRASDRNMDYVSFYSFVPNYDLSRFEALENTIRLENDYMAWMGVMRRVKYFLQVNFDLDDLERKTKHILTILDEKVDELDARAPTAGIRDYFERLSASFSEELFDPLDDVWENELRRLLDEGDSEDT